MLRPARGPKPGIGALGPWSLFVDRKGHLGFAHKVRRKSNLKRPASAGFPGMGASESEFDAINGVEFHLA
jgi:hypothetical protein